MPLARATRNRWLAAMGATTAAAVVVAVLPASGASGAAGAAPAGPSATTAPPTTTARPTATQTPRPTATSPRATATTPRPTATTPKPTATTPKPTATTPKPTPTPTPTATPFVVSRSLYGLHPGLVANSPALPLVGTLRLWDAGTSWAELQPSPGASGFVWTALDAQLDRARASGVSDVLMVLAGTPAWATDDARPGDYMQPGFPGVPRSLADWDSYVRAVVTRYKGKITSYQVWNEFNLRTFWHGTPEQMADMTARAYAIVKSVDPRATVVAASTTVRSIPGFEPFQRYYPRYLAALAARGWPVDVFAVHAYPAGNGTPTTRTAYIGVIKDALVAAKAPKRPLWETEINFGLAGPGTIPRQNLSPGLQAAWLAQTYLDALRLGVSRAYWYAWSDAAFLGIRTWPGSTAARALADVQSWTVGATWKGCTVKGVLVTCTLARGRTVQMVAWATGGSTQVAVPAGLRTGCVLTGSCTPVTPGRLLRVGPLPVRLSP